MISTPLKILSQMFLSLEARTLQAELPPLSSSILWLNPEITNFPNDDSYNDTKDKLGYSVLAVTKAVLVPYNLRQRQGHSRKHPLSVATEVVA